jgi:hypothetical protein
MNTANLQHQMARHPAWSVWENPIFRRYCQSRLRIRGLVVSLLMTVLISGFFVSIAAAVGSRADASAIDAARGPIIPLLVIQSLILFLMGTAQVAGGMVAERDEGVIDYQRLVPMSPLAKVLGYLFGLPVREWVMFLASLPFTVWCMWRGEVSWRIWLPLYTVLFSSTMVYHLTGLVAGTVVRNRRWAFLCSIGVVFALYTIVPQLAKFGLVFFKYFTLGPVFSECLPGLLPLDAAAAASTLQRLAPVVKFFGLDFSELVFTLFTQGSLILTFVVMLGRRWQRAEAHLLGKVWAVGLFAWAQIMLLGNALPLIEPGNLFPSREFGRMFGPVYRAAAGWQPEPTEAVVLSGVYGAVTVGLLALISGIITPTVDRQIQGWRRARKLGQRRIPWLSDAGSGWWFTVLMGVAGAVGWFVFTRALVESRWFPGQVLPVQVFGYFLALVLGGGLALQALLETRGAQAQRLACILVGIVPLMAGSVLCVISEALYPIGVWVLGISPVSQPFFAAASQMPIADLPPSIARTVPRVFEFWTVVGLLAASWLARDLWRKRSAMAAAARGAGVDDR